MIPDPELREMAVGKLRLEHFNAEVAATLATLVAGPHRNRAIEAIVALEVLYDYLDGLTESPLEDPLESGQRLYSGFIAVFDGPRPDERAAGEPPEAEDGGYLSELSSAASKAIAALPATAIVARSGRRAAERCAASQIRVHAAARIGAEQLEQWARADAATVRALGWREHVAGAVASVLAIHALIVAAADPTITDAAADAIESAYLSIAAVSTMLDSLVDYERDVACGDPWLVKLYGGPALLGERLTMVARRAVIEARSLPQGAHHLMTLLGVVAYYTSAPEAQSGFARASVARLHDELRPMILPTFAVMRTWRLAKDARRHLAGKPRARTKQ